MRARERFLAAIEGREVDRPPVWLMRQAGRYLPDYRAVRAQHDFWAVCHTPELSTRVALEPMRLFEPDAAIVFSDILVVPHALGLNVSFGRGEGPRIGRPLSKRSDLDAWQKDGIDERLAFLPRAVSHLRDALGGSAALLGFAGAPFTLLAYIVEGGGSDDFRRTRTLLHTDPALADAALEIIADIVAGLLVRQCEAGADLVQLFDTWGGLLTRGEYERFCVPAIARIAERLHAKGHRLLLFVRGGQHLLPLFQRTGADGFSLDWRMDWAETRAALPNAILQGNIDPILLLAPQAHVCDQTRALLSVMRSSSASRRCIVNLGHGIVPETPADNVAALVRTVRDSA